MRSHSFVFWLCQWLGESAVEDADASSLGSVKEWLCTVVLVIGHLLLFLLDDLRIRRLCSVDEAYPNGRTDSEMVIECQWRDLSLPSVNAVLLQF